MVILNIIQAIINFFKPRRLHTPTTSGSTDWVQPDISNVSQDWLKYLSLPYRTQQKGFDEANCATRAAIELLEALLNYYLQNNLFPDLIANFLKTYYCNKEGYVKLSIRYNSKLNNTTPQGANVGNVWDNFNRDGLVPEYVYPDPPSPFTWKDYYTPVPDGLEQYGYMTTKFFKILWTLIQNDNWNVPDIAKFRETLVISPIYFAGAIGNRDLNGVEQWTGLKQFQHARVIYSEDGYQEVLDSYINSENPSFLRKLSPNFPIPCAIKSSIKII